MPFDAGSIESSLELDLTPFRRGMREARRDAERFSRTRYSAVFDFDTSEAERNLERLRREAERAAERSYRIRIGMDRSEFRRGMEETEREVERLNRTEAAPQVSARGFRAANAALGSLKSGLLLLSPIAIPVLVAITGAALTMAGAFLSAGAAVGVFGVAVKNQLKPVMEAYTNLTKARKAYDKATTKEAKDKALEMQRQALKGLTTEQLRAVAAIDRFKKAFENFGSSARGPILATFISGLRALENLLVHFEPVVRPVALTIQNLVKQFETFSAGGGPKRFATFLATTGPKAIQTFVLALRDVVVGLHNIFMAFSGGQGDFLGTVERAAAAFRAWTVSPGLAKFVEAFQTAGPKTADALLAIANAVAAVVIALGPIGGLLLTAIVPLANGLEFIATNAPWAVQGLWALLAVMKAMAIIKTVTAMLGALNLAMMATRAQAALLMARMIALRIAVLAWSGGLAVARVAMTVFTVAWRLLNLAFAASPIGFIITALLGLGLAVVLAYKKFEGFRKVVNTIFSWLKTAVVFVINFVKNHWRLIITIMLGPLGLIIAGVTKWRKQIFDFFSAAIGAVINFVKKHWRLIITIMLGPLGLVIAGATKWGKQITTFFVNKVTSLLGWIKRNWRLIISIIGGPLGLAIALVTKHWNTIRQRTTDFIERVKSVIRRGMDAVKNSFANAVTGVKNTWSKIEGVTKKPVNFVINTVYNNGIRRLWNTVTGWLKLEGLKLGPVAGLKSGGSMSDLNPATPAIYDRPTAIVGEGSKKHPEYVIPTDPKYRARAGALWSQAGHKMQFMAKGGVLGGVLGGVKNFAKNVVGLGRLALDLLTNPKAVWDRFVKKLVPGMTGEGMWGQAVAAVPKKVLAAAYNGLTQIVKAFNAGYGGDPYGVVKAAEKYIGQGDSGRDNDNYFNRRWGWPAGTPWCANFVSTAIADAKAQKRYPGWPTAAVRIFNDSMRHVGVHEGRPGDLGVYRGDGHINIISKRYGPGRIYETIGGNEGPVVQRSKRGGQSSILRPLAAGGTLGRDYGIASGKGLGVFGERNFDSRDGSNELLRMLRGTFVKSYDMGGDYPPGLNIGYNNTGRTESVVTDEWRRELIARLDAIERNVTVNQTNVFQHPIDPYTASRRILAKTVEGLT